MALVSAALAIASGTVVKLTEDSGRDGQQTDREADVQRLQKFHNRFRLLFDGNVDPMWIFECSTLAFLEVNDAAVEQYGYSREEFLKMHVADIRPSEEIEGFLRHVADPEANLERRGTWKHQRRDGTVFVVEITSFPFNENGVDCELILAHDINKRASAEEGLRESRSALQSLVDNAPIGICRSSLAEDRFLTVNRAFCEMLGYTAEELLALKLSTQLYSDPMDRERAKEVVRKTKTLQSFETSLLRKDGSVLPVRAWGVVKTTSKGERDGLESYIEDVTQQSTLEQQIRRVQKLEAVGRLAGGIAHDFNNVLVAIKLCTELMLAQVTLDSPFTKHLLQVLSAADRAAGLTKQLLAFGRQQIMQVRTINLNNVVSDISHLLERVLGEDIQQVMILCEQPDSTRLDPDQLGQVILNLAVNARDAMPDGGSLTIETRNVELDAAYSEAHAPVEPGRYVLLTVSDTGCGMDKTVLSHIFDPFFTTKEVGKGTGLGLSIVYGIVKQSGGYIWVYSEPGEGTTFKLYFPVTSGDPAVAATRGNVARHVGESTVLVVEDEPVIRQNVCDCLRQLGYKVMEAADGVAALEVYEQNEKTIDLILTDLVMPNMRGDLLAKELARRQADVSMVFMSGYTEEHLIRKEILDGGHPFLMKPFSVADLSGAVYKALAMHAIHNGKLYTD